MGVKFIGTIVTTTKVMIYRLPTRHRTVTSKKSVWGAGRLALAFKGGDDSVCRPGSGSSDR